MLPSEEIVNRFINSGHHALKNIDNNHLFSELNKYSYSEKDANEYMIDNIVSKQLMIHLQDFLNKKMKTNLRQKSLKK
jgi:hypothetical protein